MRGGDLARAQAKRLAEGLIGRLPPSTQASGVAVKPEPEPRQDPMPRPVRPPLA
jgi:hypothetical protein